MVASTNHRVGLDQLGINHTGTLYWNLPTPTVVEQIIQRQEGLMAHLGAIVVHTGKYTGRAAGDKFIVSEAKTQQEIWWGEINRPVDPETFDRLFARQLAYLQDKDLFVEDCYAGADPQYQLPVRVITETAWHNLFSRNMLIREFDAKKIAEFVPQFTIVHTPRFEAVPAIDGTRSEAFIILNLSRRLVIIGGTHYAGEIKKSVFTLMNYLLPHQNVLPMHSSVNYGKNKDDVAVFFGLSGTGKTTLSTSADRMLIGDDEHGWSDNGVFNFEGGCYAKVIRLNPQTEPEIYDSTRKFGTILENVVIDPVARHVDLDDGSITENTRATYPITHIPHADITGTAGHPKNILFLTYDAFGVLPPISRLTAEQAEFHFLCGYTSKVAGTEAGIKEPQATFSACFGAPFMPMHPTVYARMLKQKINHHGVNCWLVNTGLTGGSYGTGERMALPLTRAMVAAVLKGELDDADTIPVERFHLSRLTKCPGIPETILDPRATWSDKAAYDHQAEQLAKRFEETIAKFV
ncbi:MAG: phosphoenolpyruvate carboxykinase (ATP) [Planctomycetota bacterium]|nr:phosphoenolpyruvate carboxykinase (ATP) [Planctomycetota bacterium]